MEVVKCKYTVYLDEAFYMWQLRHRLLYETVGTMTWRKREIYVYVLNKSKVLVIKGKYTSGLPMNETDKNHLQNDGAVLLARCLLQTFVPSCMLY